MTPSPATGFGNSRSGVVIHGRDSAIEVKRQDIYRLFSTLVTHATAQELQRMRSRIKEIEESAEEFAKGRPANARISKER